MAETETGCPHASNEHEMTWEQEADQAGFHHCRKQLSRAASANKLHCNLVEVPPRNSAGPLHYHTEEEEVRVSECLLKR